MTDLSLTMQQWHTNVWNEIPEHTFTIASTDSIDKLQSYSPVYCSDQQHGYHGTTVQLRHVKDWVQLFSARCLNYPWGGCYRKAVVSM